MMKPSECLRETHAVLAQGWCKEVGTDGHDNHCIIGAMGVVERKYFSNLGYAWSEPMNEASKYLGEQARSLGYTSPIKGPVPAFNDDPNTTHEDVLNFVEKAALAFEEKGK